MAKRLCFTIDGAEYRAALQDHALAESLSAMCPFALDYTRSGEHEYYAALPGKAVVKGCSATTKGNRNGLYYFEGWNALALVFRDCNTASYQIHQIGVFEDDVSAALEKMGGRVRIYCELERGV